MRWERCGKRVGPEGTTIYYRGVGTDYKIESRKRHIPHANGSGTWDHTTYVVLKNGHEMCTKYSLADAKEFADQAMTLRNTPSEEEREI